jgi:hypothetical protein
MTWPSSTLTGGCTQNLRKPNVSTSVFSDERRSLSAYIYISLYDIIFDYFVEGAPESDNGTAHEIEINDVFCCPETGRGRAVLEGNCLRDVGRAARGPIRPFLRLKYSSVLRYRSWKHGCPTGLRFRSVLLVVCSPISEKGHLLSPAIGRWPRRLPIPPLLR